LVFLSHAVQHGQVYVNLTSHEQKEARQGRTDINPHGHAYNIKDGGTGLADL